jgi:Mandelate racemase / muconate lactonizing enzyme, N-terminal domain
MVVSGLNWSRRKFLKVTGGAAFLSGLFPLAAAEEVHTRITDIQTMTLSGQRTYVLVKVVADDGRYGIAEAYGTPSIGVKEQIQALKPLLVGKNPLEIDTLYTYMGIGGPELSGTRTDGSAHSLMRAASGIEMLFGIWQERSSKFPQRGSSAEGFAIRSGYTITRRPAICWTKHPAANGQKRSRRIPAALPRTRSGFATQTRPQIVPGTWAIDFSRPGS